MPNLGRWPLKIGRPRAFSHTGLLATLSGVGIGLGQAPFQFWLLALLGIGVSVYLWLKARDAKHAASIGWCAGFGTFLTALIWFAQPFLVDPLRHGWMIPFALFGMAGGLALFWSLAFGLSRRFELGLLGLPALWAVFELLRGYIFTGFPWALPAYIWLDTAPAHLAAWIGPYGLTGVTFGLGALLGLIMSLSMHSSRRIHLFASAAFFCALGLAMFTLGDGRRSLSLPADNARSVRIVQPNAAQHLKWDPAYISQFFERALELSTPGDADLVVWPETSVAAPIYAAQPYFDAISEASFPAKTVVGVQRVTERRGYNSAAVLGRDGAIEALYDKRHLVPFGEYTPLPWLLNTVGLRSFTAQAGYGYSTGESTTLFDFGDLGRALPLICYEAIFPRELRHFERPDWLLQITNDAWFGTFSGPQQSLAQSRFRSIETGLPMVRAANTGVSAIIDAHGNIRASIGLGDAGGVTHNLPRALPETFYARFGELPVVIFLMLWVLGARVASFRRKSIETV